MLHRRFLVGLCGFALAMFGFGFALVPLYDVFCDITGINGKPVNQPAVMPTGADLTDANWINVEFIAHVHQGIPWHFEPELKQIRVQLGAMNKVNFMAKNQANYHTIGQAIPSVSPGLAATHLHKVECFCFQQQQLSPLASVEMPLIFYIDKDISPDIKTVTLSYTMFSKT
jgi:cytochrome c oxidase assembly protein subunit 11